jgi:hypothetical protein
VRSRPRLWRVIGPSVLAIGAVSASGHDVGQRHTLAVVVRSSLAAVSEVAHASAEEEAAPRVPARVGNVRRLGSCRGAAER